jgi:uncharacterized RDD family membrane protein YckC
MKNSTQQLFLGAAVAIFFTLTFTALAQEKPTPSPEPASQAAPAATPASTSTPAAPEPTPAPAVADAPKQPELRRLDEPELVQEGRHYRRGGSSEFPLGDHTVPKGSTAGEVVSILGSSTVEGEVESGAVAIGGDTIIGPDAKVGGEAVAIFGKLSVKGQVSDEAVSVFGGVYIDGHVGQEVVSVLGNLELGPNAVVDGDIVVIGGQFKADPKAVVRGNRVNVPVLGTWNNADGLVTWFKKCLMLGRPLAFARGLGFAWAFAFAFFALYVLIALIFRSGVDKCVTTLETRPGSSILAAILSILLTPVVIVLLCVTVIGIVAVPFLALGLICAGLVGKTVMLAWVGRRITKFFGDGPLSHTAFAVIVGGAIVLLLYCVPVVGMLVQKSFDLLGFGVVIYTVMLANKREKPPAPPRAPVAPMPVTPMPTPIAPAPAFSAPLSAVAPSVTAPAMPMTSAGFGATGAASEPIATGALPVVPPPSAEPPPSAFAAAAAVPPFVPVQPASAVVISAAINLRAGFLIRLAALALDVVLWGIIAGILHIHGPLLLPWLAIYGAVMWKFKGTTIGGVVCGLKIVRIDDRPIDWATAIVRALGCFLSLAVVGLGFLWVAIDEDKQSWHDKIAGTTVVRVPKGTSLI